MNLTRETMEAWAVNARVGPTILRLEAGETCATAFGTEITGPAIVEIIRYVDGDWSARALRSVTPAIITLAATGTMPS